MQIIGLTGSIAMGKSTSARHLRQLGIPVFDSDAAVHGLFVAGGKAVAPIKAVFPSAIENNAVNREKLGRLVFGKPEALKQLEAIVHPLVRLETMRFLSQQQRLRRRKVALDVPLLFETQADRRVDLVLTVTAPAFVQRQRVLRRDGMTEEKLAAILSRQTPDASKRRWSDALVRSSNGLGFARRDLRKALAKKRDPGRVKPVLRTSRSMTRGHRPKAWPINRYRNPAYTRLVR